LHDIQQKNRQINNLIALIKRLDFLYFLGYNIIVIEIRQTEIFNDWFKSLRDKRAKARISARIDRASMGNFGDCVPVGEGVSEMRIHYGPGYRVYFSQRGREIVIILAGGDKHTQDKDIKMALELARSI
jgi:putative addiction module killer protein